MELPAFDRIFAVAEAHDDAVLGAGGDLELAREAVFRDDQRVIASAGHGAGDAGEERTAVVDDFAGLAVHELGGADHLAAEGGAAGLVAETHAEDRHFACEVLNERDSE